MSRWFRWYEGTTEDGKFRVAARMSRVTVRDVIALWAFVLEDAAHLDHRGVCVRNEDFMSAILDFEDGEVERILSALQDLHMLEVGATTITVCNWNKRQFESDVDSTATDRQRRKRERDKMAGNEPVTRDTATSDTETDTDTETERELNARARPISSDWKPKDGKGDPAEVKRFIDYNLARGSKMADWDAAWSVWLSRQRDFGKAGDEPAEGTPGTPTTWVNEEDPLWVRVAPRWLAEKGHALIPTTSRHGHGYGAHIPSDWLTEPKAA